MARAKGITVDLEAILKAPAFQEPSKPDATIWRYLDFPKLVSLLESSALYFARADRLGDPWEGSTTKALATLMARKLRVLKGTLEDAEALARISAYRKELVRWSYVNCWHMNEHESAAMWKLYGNGFAVRSDFTRLKKCLSQAPDVRIGEVRYLDFEKDLQSLDLSAPLMSKRKSFEHERELRAVIQNVPAPMEWFRAVAESGGASNQQLGLSIKVDLADLVERIHVAPSSEPWIFETVKRLIPRYGLNLEVRQSDMEGVPLY